MKRKAARRRARRRDSPGRWSALAEKATLERAPGDLETARAAFRALPETEQRQLAREIANSRRAELTLAYADVVAVSAGYRLVSDPGGTRRVAPEVCVTLVVKRKRAKARVSARRRVPEHLFAYWTIDGRRALCAVPTDVEDAHRLGRIRPQTQIEAIAPDFTPTPLPGAIACAIVRNDDGIVYAIGCRHVFGLALVLDPSKHYAAQVRPVGSTAAVGQATPIAGQLANGLEYSFDSHLARVTDEDLLRQAVGGLTFTARVASWDDLHAGVDYWIATPRGLVRAHWAGLYTEPIHYTPTLHDVRHFQLGKFLLPDGPTLGGDSGSPVMAARGGGTLIGMLIAGDGRDVALVIPAWQLFHAPWYGLGPESWALWPIA